MSRMRILPEQAKGRTASGVKTPDEKARFMSDLKVRLPKMHGRRAGLRNRSGQQDYGEVPRIAGAQAMPEEAR